MPFGKYKGRAIKEVPIDYIQWMLANIQNMTPSLYSALTTRLKSQKTADVKE